MSKAANMLNMLQILKDRNIEYSHKSKTNILNGVTFTSGPEFFTTLGLPFKETDRVYQSGDKNGQNILVPDIKSKDNIPYEVTKYFDCCMKFLEDIVGKENIVERVKELIASLKIGDPSKMDTDMGPMININAAKRIEDQVNQTISQGATLVCGGKREDAYYEPTILDNVTKDMDIMKDMEVFGPVIPICGFDDIEEAIEIANQSSFGLCGNIITSDMNNAFKVAERLEVGGAVINGSSFFRSAEMPFGGWKHSGIGNEGIATTLQEMSRIKTIVLKNIL